MPKIPDISSYGARPTPQPGSVPNIVGTRASIGEGVARGADIMSRDANQVGSDTASFAAEIGQAGERIAAAERRMYAREDAVTRAKDYGAFSETVLGDLRRRQTEGDFSNPAEVAGFREAMNAAKMKILQNHRGSAESKLALSVTLEEAAARYGDDAARLAVSTSNKLMAERFGQIVNQRASDASLNPSGLPQVMQAIEKDLADLSPALSPEQETQYRAMARQQATLGAVSGFLNKGDWRAARTYLNDTPGLRAMLAPEAQRNLDQRISTFELEDAKARTAGLRKVEEARQILGRDLTLPERVKLAGLDMTGAQTPSQKIEGIEAALGRKLSDPERERVVGLQIDPAKLSDEGSMRNQFVTLSKDFVQTRDSFSRIQAATKEPSAAGDLALIFNFMKILDPQSVVREGEFATAQSAAGVPDRVRNIYNRLLSGERLNDTQRSDFVNQSQNLYNAQLRTHKTLEKQFREIATRAGINPANVVIDFEAGEITAPTSTPRIQYDLHGRRIGGGERK